MSWQQKMSERELADLLNRGDPSVMEGLYVRYASYLTGVCSRYIADDQCVKDVLQESFIKIFTQGHTFTYRGEGALKAWITRIVVNESLDYLKELKRRELFTSDMEQLEAPEDTNTNEINIDNVPTEVLFQLIRDLPLGYRTVFNLYVIEGMKHKQIAELLGIQEQTSASQFFRAKAKLAKKIKEYVKLKQESR
ncbi:MAG: sigma-70 family RNA polymerase sigma factor [Bacteroidaceae bacterium]|nr:sigma-70 family RNA polymerase sigma factor [Bacteroidaceae bacterium]